MAAIGGLALGCPPTDYGKKCRFTGDDETPCGICIATLCQGYVDQCCASTNDCADELSALDACAAGQDCTSLVSKSSASAGSGIRAVSQCAQASCANACAALGGLPSQRVSCTTESGSCTCQELAYQVTGSASEVRCPSSLRSGNAPSGASFVCCATSRNWPTIPDGTCQCTAYAAGTTGECSSAEYRVPSCR